MEAAAIYGLESQGRALCSQRNNEMVETVQFFMGTLSPRSEGQIHQIDFDDESNKLTRKIYKPRIGEIWQIQCAANPMSGVANSSSNFLGICYNNITETSAQLKAGIWSQTSKNGVDDNQELVLQCNLSPEDADLIKQNVQCLDWHPSEAGRIATVMETSLLVWDMTDGGVKVSHSVPFKSKLDNGKWNPHLYGNQFTLITGSSVSGIDLRSNQESWTMPKAHNFQVRDVDFNPNKQYYLATCGDDCLTKFWDFRNSSVPLKKLEGHSHWVWRVRYNSCHDQLVLTAGSDSTVILHSIPSISSEPKGKAVFSDSEEEVEKAQETKPEDGVLAKYEEHEDAVYAVEWSNYDCWVFASLSYDGRCLINRVPKSEKYKILL